MGTYSCILRLLLLVLLAEHVLTTPLPNKDEVVKDRTDNGLQGSKTLKRQVRQVYTNTYRKWPRGRIPYLIDEGFNATMVRLIEQAMAEFHRTTCVRFVPRTRESDYLYIYPGTSCSAHIGRVGGEQYFSLGDGTCERIGVMFHELMHVLGFIHEHTRPDRDKYVIVTQENLPRGYGMDFYKQEASDITLLTDYNYDSISHYESGIYSQGRGRINLQPVRQGIVIPGAADRTSLPAVDVQRINMYYNCE